MEETKQTYHSNGKLLLTGEYLVLRNALALALPVRLGQTMDVTTGPDSRKIVWKARDIQKEWFSCHLEWPGLDILKSSDAETASLLQKILLTILQINPQAPLKGGLTFSNYMEFNREWGLGSSSTLIANLASWAGIDPFELNKRIFKGSGFDIACAKASGPLLYQKNSQPIPVELHYPFSDNLYLVYSGTKKKTRNAVNQFLDKKHATPPQIKKMNAITTEMANAKSLAGFQHLMQEHEKLISGIIGIPPLKRSHFNSFKGEIKSLGAWGGDFFLAATDWSKKKTTHYFSGKGLKVIFPWNDLILQNHTKQKA